MSAPLTISILPPSTNVRNRNNSANSKIASSVITGFQIFLQNNPDIYRTFVQLYNNSNKAQLTQENANILQGVAKKAWKTKANGIDQSESDSMRSFLINLQSNLFHTSIITLPPLATVPENAFFSLFFLYLASFSQTLNQTYDQLYQRVRDRDNATMSEYNQLLKYLLNTNYLTLFLIFIYHFQETMRKLVPDIKAFIQSLQSQSLNLQKRANKELGRKFGKLMDKIAPTKEPSPPKTKFEILLNSPPEKLEFSQLFYLTYTAGYLLIEIQKIDASKKFGTVFTPMESNNIFYEAVKQDTSTSAPTDADMLVFIVKTFDKSRTQFTVFFDKALSMGSRIIPVQAYPSIKPSELTGNNTTINAQGGLVATSLMHYMAHNSFMDRAVLRLGTGMNQEPTICPYFEIRQSYQLYMPKAAIGSALVYGFSRSARERENILRNFGTSEEEPILFAVMKNNALMYTDQLELFQTKEPAETLQMYKKRAGISLKKAEQDASYTVTFKTTYTTNNSNNANANNIQNANINNNNNRLPRPRRPTGIASIKLIHTAPTQKNNNTVYKGRMGGQDVLKVQRVVDDKTKSNSKYDVDIWQVTIANVTVGVIEYNQTKSTRAGLYFDITVPALVRNPQMGVAITPLVTIVALIIGNNFYSTHETKVSKNIKAKASIAVKRKLADLMGKVRGNKQVNSKSPSVVDLAKNIILSQTLRIC